MGSITVRDHLPDVIKAAFQLLHIPSSLVDVAMQVKDDLAPDPVSAAAKRLIDDRSGLLETRFRDLPLSDRQSADELAKQLLTDALDDNEVLGLALENPEGLLPLFLGRVPPDDPDTDDARSYLRALLRLVCTALTELLRPTDLQTRALHAAVGQLLRILRDGPTGPKNGHEGVQSAQQPIERRILTDASLAAVLIAGPKTLPEVQRLEDLASDGDAVLDHFPLVVLGDGGSGKSVLATQLFAHYCESVRGLTLFVPCAQVPASQDVSSCDALDRAFAHAMGQPDHHLSDLIDLAGPVTVIIDTLDLLLSDDNADSMAEVIRKLGNRCQLILTCRNREWQDFLAANPLLDVYKLNMPALGHSTVMAWASLYVKHRIDDSKMGDAFLVSLERALGRGSTAEVFGSPVRLAMTCEVYAATGALPENLSVTSLYDEYWEAKINRDRRARRGVHARPRRDAANLLARDIWEASEQRFTEFVPVDHTGNGLSALVSEGIVRIVGEKGGFFHQTFAEYGVARHLSAHGNAEDWLSLSRSLQRGSASEWGIVGHLAMLSLDELTFRDVAGCLPLSSPEGLRILLRAAVKREDNTMLAEVLQGEVNQRPANLAASLDVLATAPTATCNAVLPLLVPLAAETQGRTHCLNSLARLFQRSTANDKSSWLASTARAVLDSPTPTSKGDLVNVFDKTIGRVPEAYEPRQLMYLYEELPAGARAAITMSAAAHAHENAVPFLDKALFHPAPLKAKDSLLVIADWAFSNTAASRALGWTSWRNMLDAEYPVGWRMVQTHLAARKIEDWQLDELVAALCERDLPHRKEFTDVAHIVARDRPHQLARALSLQDAPREEAVASSLAGVAGVLATQPVDSTPLIDAIRPLRGICPLDVEPALARLSAREPATLRRGVHELLSLGQSANTPEDHRVVRRTWDALFDLLSLDQISDFSSELEGALQNDAPRERNRLIRLWARLSPVSVKARQRISEVFQDPGAQKLANEAANVLEKQIEGLEACPQVEWLAQLLGSRHGNSVAIVARLLTRSGLVDLLSERDVERIFSRIGIALTVKEETQTLKALFELLASLARLPGRRLGGCDVQRVLDALWKELESWRDRGYPQEDSLFGLYQQLNFGLTGIALPILDEEQVTAQVARLLTALDTGSIGIQPRRSLANTLIIVTTRYPLSWSRFDACWVEASDSNKLAMAEWITRGRVFGKAGIALAFARRPDCPDEVAHYIHKAMGR